MVRGELRRRPAAGAVSQGRGLVTQQEPGPAWPRRRAEMPGQGGSGAGSYLVSRGSYSPGANLDKACPPPTSVLLLSPPRTHQGHARDEVGGAPTNREDQPFGDSLDRALEAGWDLGTTWTPSGHFPAHLTGPGLFPGRLGGPPSALTLEDSCIRLGSQRGLRGPCHHPEGVWGGTHRPNAA